MTQTPRHKAMNLLARREYSQGELTERLHRAFPDESADVLAEVIATLAEEGLQSDQRFVEGYVRLRVSRGQGPRKIAQELVQRGVDGDLSAPELAALDWAELAAEALHKRFGAAPPHDERERARRARFMTQRGFEWDQFAHLIQG